MPDIALFDLDGVVRGFAESERWPDVAAVAFAPGLLDEVVTGRMTDDQWRAEVLRRLGPGAAEEVTAWSASCGEVNDAVLEVVRTVRDRTPVGLFTNGTSRLTADLGVLGIAGEFDVIFNSSELGVAKPEVAAYRIVSARLGLPPQRVFFVDDSPAHVDGAREAGWQAALYVDAALLIEELRAAGVLRQE